MNTKQITSEHLQVLMDPCWETTSIILEDLIRFGLWNDKQHQPNQRGQFLIGELVHKARRMLEEIR